MKTLFHAVTGMAALLTICGFWLATVFTEMLLDDSAVTAVKWTIMLCVPALIILMVAAGGSGSVLASSMKSPIVARKMKRMRIAAANGVLVLVPAAIYLAFAAKAGRFDWVFVIVQCAELIAGAVNIAMLGFNARDGLRIARARKNRRQPAIDPLAEFRRGV